MLEWPNPVEYVNNMYGCHPNAKGNKYFQVVFGGLNKMNKLVISLRRHAETNAPSYKAKPGEIRFLTEEGKRAALKIGRAIKEPIIAGCGADQERYVETLHCLITGSGQADVPLFLDNVNIDEPIITPEYRKMINRDNRNRTERFQFYLTQVDPSGESTSPFESAIRTSYFIAETAKNYAGLLGRVEAITGAPR